MKVIQETASCALSLIFTFLLHMTIEKG